MKQEASASKPIWILLCGILGTILLASSDWLMIYGDTAYEGQLAWLTNGVAQIPAGRNTLAMVLSFPAVICYCAALYGIRPLLRESGDRKVYSALTAVGMTPWLCLHLFYTMILYLFAWLCGNGQQAVAFPACEALFAHFAWIVPAAEVLMLLPFLYWFYVTVRGRSIFSRWMALSNPLLLYVVLKLLTLVMPNVPARLAFTNGLMSEAMLLWFLLFLVVPARKKL